MRIVSILILTAPVAGMTWITIKIGKKYIPKIITYIAEEFAKAQAKYNDK